MHHTAVPILIVYVYTYTIQMNFDLGWFVTVASNCRNMFSASVHRPLFFCKRSSCLPSTLAAKNWTDVNIESACRESRRDKCTTAIIKAYGTTVGHIPYNLAPLISPFLARDCN